MCFRKNVGSATTWRQMQACLASQLHDAEKASTHKDDVVDTPATSAILFYRFIYIHND